MGEVRENREDEKLYLDPSEHARAVAFLACGCVQNPARLGDFRRRVPNFTSHFTDSIDIEDSLIAKSLVKLHRGNCARRINKLSLGTLSLSSAAGLPEDDVI